MIHRCRALTPRRYRYRPAVNRCVERARTDRLGFGAARLAEDDARVPRGRGRVRVRLTTDHGILEISVLMVRNPFPYPFPYPFPERRSRFLADLSLDQPEWIHRSGADRPLPRAFGNGYGNGYGYGRAEGVAGSPPTDFSKSLCGIVRRRRLREDRSNEAREAAPKRDRGFSDPRRQGGNDAGYGRRSGLMGEKLSCGKLPTGIPPVKD